MTVLAIVFGMLILAVGLVGLASPQKLLTWVRSLESPGGLLIAAGGRLLFAVVLWLAAPASKYPLAMQTLAGVAAFASLVLPLLGQERFAAFVDGFSRSSAAVVRVWLLSAVAFGGFVTWAALPA